MAEKFSFPFLNRRKPETIVEKPSPNEIAKMMWDELNKAHTIGDFLRALRQMKSADQNFNFFMHPTPESPNFTREKIDQLITTLETIERLAPESRDTITQTQIRNLIDTLPQVANMQTKVRSNWETGYVFAVQHIDVSGILPPRPTEKIPPQTEERAGESLPAKRAQWNIQRLVDLEERLSAIEENRELLPKERLLDPDTPFEEVMNILKGMADRQVILVDDKGNAFATKALLGSINAALSLFRGQEFLSDEDFRHVIRAINLLPKQFSLRDRVLKEILSWYDEVAAANNSALKFPPLTPIE